MGFERLVRFIASDGNTYYGDAVPNSTPDLAQTKQAKVIEGDIYGSYKVTDKVLVSQHNEVQLFFETGLTEI